MKSNPFMASKDNTVKGPLLDEECSHAQVLTFLLGRGSLSTVLCDPWPQSVGSSFFSSLAVSEVGSLSLLQGIFLTQELNQGLLHCRWILYQLSYQGSHLPKIG